MADEITDPKSVAEHNAEVIKQQAAQDISGQPAGGPTNLDGASSLDALREDKIKEAKELVQPNPEDAAAAEAAAKKKAEDDAAAAAAATGTTTATPPVVDDAAAVAAKKKAEDDAAAAATKAAEDAAVSKRAELLFKDSPGLAPNASAKSGEAFSSVKLTAAREVSRLESENAELRKKVSEAEEKLKNPIPPELEQELKAHREFRAKLDVDSDPKFKEFDKTVADANEFIYSQLKKSPVVTDEIIADIKKYGGPANVNMEKILEAVKDPLIRRLVESKLADVEMVRYQKEQAIQSTKSNIAKYLEDREKELQTAATSHNSSTKQNLEAMASKIEWLNPKPIDPKLDANAKKALEDHNAYAAHARKELDLAITDDSPEMRATLLVGMVQLFRLQAAHDVVTKRAAELETKLKAVEEANAKLKSASVSRLRDSGAPITPSTAPKKGPDFTESAAVAVDRIRQEKLKAQQAA